MKIGFIYPHDLDKLVDYQQHISNLYAMGNEIYLITTSDSIIPDEILLICQVVRITQPKNIFGWIPFFVQAELVARNCNWQIAFVFSRRFCSIFGIFNRLHNYVSKKKVISYFDLRSGSVTGHFDSLKNFFTMLESIPFHRISFICKPVANIIWGKIPPKSLELGLGTHQSFFLEPTTTPKENVLLYIGTLDKVRELHIFFNEIEYDIDDFNIILLGYGDEESVALLKNIFEKKNILNKVKFIGQVPFYELVNYLSIAKVGLCLIPNKPYFTNQPATKLYEYIAANIPTLVTKTNFYISTKELHPYCIEYYSNIKLSHIISESSHIINTKYFDKTKIMKWSDWSNILYQDFIEATK